jgi:hypothetical protein
MSYDPTPIGPTSSDASGQPDALHVHVTGKRDPDVLYIVGKPRNGVVEVREIVGGCAPREYAIDAGELLGRFERAQRERRRMGVELYAIRRWLEG